MGNDLRVPLKTVPEIPEGFNGQWLFRIGKYGSQYHASAFGDGYTLNVKARAEGCGERCWNVVVRVLQLALGKVRVNCLLLRISRLPEPVCQHLLRFDRPVKGACNRGW